MSKILTLASSGYQMSDTSLCGALPDSGLPMRPVPRKKIHCVLPSSPWLADSKTNIPLGVLYIAGLLREAGHDIVVTSMLDKRYEGNISLPDNVMDADVHMFGFCTPQFGEALELAAYIKDRTPDALVVAGGPHPSYEPVETKLAGRQEQYHVKGALPRRRDYRAADGRQLFDTVIVMEGERATLQMLSDWHQGALQPYYYGDKTDAMDLDLIPFPAWDLLPDDHIYNDGVAVMKNRYFESTVKPGTWPVMSMIGTRGCPYKCTYCFTEGTMIDMADGKKRPIESLRSGDLVLSFDQSTGLVEPQPVKHIFSRFATDIYELRLSDGTVLQVTGDHPFVTDKGWRDAKDCEGSYVRRVRQRTSESIAMRMDSQNMFRRVRRNRKAQAEETGVYSRAESAISGSSTSPPDGTYDCTESSEISQAMGDASSRREVACGAYGTNGKVQSYGQRRNVRKDACDGQTTICRGPKDYSAKTSREIICFSATRIDQAASGTQTRYPEKTSQFRTDETEQSYEESRGRRSYGRDTQRNASARTYQAPFACRIKRARVAIIQFLERFRIAAFTLWRSSILDRALSIWTTAQSRYETCIIGETCDSLFSPILAYAGGYRNTDSRLHWRGMECPSFLGGLLKNSRVDELGGCPGERIFGDWIRVESVSFVGRGTVYPISITRNETFFAEGIATHNCSTPWIGTKPRYRSPQNIIGEMKKAFDLGIFQIKWQDDTYTLHKTKLRQLADAIYSEFGDTTFASRIHTRVNTLDDHVAESLKKMSCKVTCFGIESGSQCVLDANQKGTKVHQNTDAIKRAKDHGFYTIAFLVTGLAGETLETAEETRQWLLSVKGYLDSCNLAVGIPYPGSRFWTHPQESGIDIVDYNYDNQWIVGFSDRDEILVRPHGATIEDMFRIKNDMFQFLVEHGWAKAEWDEDVRIRQRQDEAVRKGVLPPAAASTLTYAGH